MTAKLGQNQYGKAESRIVRIVRDTPRHEIRDLSVSTSLRGDFDAAHMLGEQSGVLPTDSQKNAAFAFAKEKALGAIEGFARVLAEHFVDSVSSVRSAQVAVDEYAWERIEVNGSGHDHSFVRRGEDVRTTAVTVSGSGEARAVSVVSGLKDLVILKSTGSEFRGFHVDKYTTLAETDDRILATSLVARWRYRDLNVDFDATHESIKATILEQFAQVHSHALQESLYRMGAAVVDGHETVGEIRFSAPNRHHFLADLAPFELPNPGEVFFAADRPYGLIEVGVVRDGEPAGWPLEAFC